MSSLPNSLFDTWFNFNKYNTESFSIFLLTVSCTVYPSQVELIRHKISFQVGSLKNIRFIFCAINSQIPDPWKTFQSSLKPFFSIFHFLDHLHPVHNFLPYFLSPIFLQSAKRLEESTTVEMTNEKSFSVPFSFISITLKVYCTIHLSFQFYMDYESDRSIRSLNTLDPSSKIIEPFVYIKYDNF